MVGLACATPLIGRHRIQRLFGYFAPLGARFVAPANACCLLVLEAWFAICNWGIPGPPSADAMASILFDSRLSHDRLEPKPAQPLPLKPPLVRLSLRGGHGIPGSPG